MNQEKNYKRRYNFQKLTPISNAKLKTYDEALDFVFEDNDIKNVAISGPYSAGKSSLIESYKLNNSDKRFLHISLAHFAETHTENSSIKEKKTTEISSGKSILEGKILNQLIHQIKPKKIPQTRFKVKQKTEPKKIIYSATIITLFLILVYYIYSFDKWSSFVPKLEFNWLKNTLMWTTSNITLLFSGLACFVILGITIYYITILQKNNNYLKRLKLQGNEIEIFEDKDDSYFDKYLNEVLYLFDHSNADAIVFEDMDRFNVNEIFEKLREINTLVNNKKIQDNKKTIRFFYLLRDDIFVSKDRTKFFDFIIPIVPVIDGSNSYDQLIDHFKKGNILDLFDENFLNELSLYIDDMRILKNIYNEFLIYHNRIMLNDDELHTEQESKTRLDSTLIQLDINKLLGIIVYKNIFPKDFSDLHLRTGFIFTLFENKILLIEQEVERIQHEIGVIEEKIQSSEDENLESIYELDVIYLKFVPQIYSVGNKTSFEFNTQTQLIKEMKDNPTNIGIRDIHGNRYVKDVTSELENLEKNAEYSKRKEAIERKSYERIEKLKTKLQELIKQKNKLLNSKLKELINKNNIDIIFSISHTNEIGEKNEFKEIKASNYFPLIKYLVRYGYIDENYSDYMTYFYENSLSRIDKNFLLSVTDQIPKDYSYALNDTKKIISRLNLGYFDNVEILNFDLLSHLLLTKSDNTNYLSNFLHQLKETRNLYFIRDFLELRKETETKFFIEEINNMWPNIFRKIKDDSEFSHNQRKQYSVYSMYYSPDKDIENLNKENCLSDFISNTHDYLDIKSPNTEKLIAGFSLIGVKFDWIDYEVANTRLFHAVYQNNLYKLTFDLICLMLERVYGLPKDDDFKNKNYTLVISKPDEPLAKYVNSNIKLYIQELLENCDKRITDEETVALSIINHSDVDKDYKRAYISYLETVIKHIDSVQDKEIWALLLQEQVVKYSENNILNYFFNHELDSYLINFINESNRLLRFNSNSINNEFGDNSASKFFAALVNSNEITNEKYESILKAFNRRYTAISNNEIEEDKMQILINIDTIRMTEKNLIFMRENYTSLLMFFITHNIRQYTEEVINEDNFVMDELLLILDGNVDDKYKISLLEISSDTITLKGMDYSVPVKLHILVHNFNIEDIPFLLDSYSNERNEAIKSEIRNITTQDINEIIYESYSVPFELLTELFLEDELEVETKMELFAQHIPEMSDKEIVKSLRTLYMEDFLSLLNRKRPTFEINNVNETILDEFKKRKWITGFNTDENNTYLFRAIGRDRSDILELI